jgi:hypothetical protein
MTGLCPWFGLSHSVCCAQGLTKGAALNLKGIVTAGPSHRLTSGGKAEAAPTGTLEGKDLVFRELDHQKFQL